MGYVTGSEDGHIVAFGSTFAPHMLGRGAPRMRDQGRPEDWVHSLLQHTMIEARAAFHRPCHASWCLAYKVSQDMYNLTVQEGGAHIAPKGAIKTIISKASDETCGTCGANSRISRGRGRIVVATGIYEH